MKQIAVTGAYGFIGQHLCKRLVELGYTVYDVAKNSQAIGIYSDAIIHLAGTTTLSKDFNPALFHNNITYPEALFSRYKDHKIIYATSTSAAELTNPYAYTKRYLEHLGEQHSNAVGLRFFNCYGPGNNKGIVKAALDAAFRGAPLTIAGGDQIRDFIHVDDVVRTIIDSLEWKPGIYDVGTGKGTSVRHLIGMIEEITGLKIDVTYTDKRDVDMEYSVAFPPIYNCIPLYEGLKRMVCEY